MDRRFLLRPSESTNDIFLFVLAAAAARFGVLVHVFAVLSNHWHAVVTDPDARLPEFLQYVDSLVARAVNASLGRWEHFWAPSSYSAVVLPSPADILEKAAYVLANPVAADLVRSARDWPGLWSAPERIGGDAFVARRPGKFFRANGSMPAEIELALVAPPGFTAEEFRTKLAEALAERERECERRRASEGRSVMGRKAVLAQRTTSRPAGLEPRRGMRPTVASRDRWKRVEVLQRLKAFLRSYRDALARRRAGEPYVFPSGTYQLRVFHGVPCEATG